MGIVHLDKVVYTSVMYLHPGVQMGTNIILGGKPGE